MRKYAHIMLYSILGMSVFLYCSSGQGRIRRKALLSFLICFLYACSDEFHQCFVPGRTASFKDVLIDSLGFGGVILFMCLIGRKRSEDKSGIRE